MLNLNFFPLWTFLALVRVGFLASFKLLPIVRRPAYNAGLHSDSGETLRQEEFGVPFLEITEYLTLEKYELS
jgi:hypothetical protein